MLAFALAPRCINELPWDFLRGDRSLMFFPIMTFLNSAERVYMQRKVRARYSGQRWDDMKSINPGEKFYSGAPFPNTGRQREQKYPGGGIPLDRG